ncbi:MAG: hypothetical protein COW65_01125 [Cytophagales bacterium CG18_big_fil_WC_8_21_14_2_50_42_9]|nr:MAG: hypothetical protein COW65_01125 [Cytophagales bacterium CG18_big_fil_WC_8_21_14_2_50_42_9]
MSTSLKSWLAVAGLLMGLVTASLGQSATNETINITLSQPGKPGTLRVNLLHGSINVSGYNGKEVTVSYAQRGGRDNDDDRNESEGLRRLSNNNLGLEVREDNNNISIKTSAIAQPVDLNIRVPHNFSLKLKTLNNGQITVEEINGELDIDNLNGNIFLRNVSGSASASTLNGNIVATFRKVTPNMPMAFSSLNGKIDVSLPATAKFNAKLKTDNGEIFTDFAIAMDKSAKAVQKENLSSGQRIYLDKWMYGLINGGGPEMLFKNFNGNIYIRKTK